MPRSWWCNTCRRVHEAAAWRLDSLSELSIKEAAQGDVLEPNHVLVAPGGKHLQVRRAGDSVKAVIRDGPVVSGHKPRWTS